MTADSNRDDPATPDRSCPVSPFEDPAVLARTTAILQRGYERYLAAQRDKPPQDDTDQRDASGGEAA